MPARFSGKEMPYHLAVSHAGKCMYDQCCFHFSEQKPHGLFFPMFILKVMFSFYNMISFACSNAKLLKRVFQVVGPIQLLVLVQELVPSMPCDSFHR